MTKDTALRLALPLLKSAHVATDLVWPRHDAVQAIEAALALPPRQPLTPGTIRKLYARHNDPVEFVRAVEKLHGVGA